MSVIATHAKKSGCRVTLSRELKNLESINLPGALEQQNAQSATKVRSPSYRRALLIYTDALEAIQGELDEFNAQQYLDSPFAELPNTDLKSRFKSLRSREQVLRVASNDLLPLLEKSGLTNDRNSIKEKVDLIFA